MMPNNDRIPLTALPRELTARTGKPSPSYRRLYSLTVDGHLPAEQDNSRWFIRRVDLPVIAAMLNPTALESETTDVSLMGAGQ